MIYWKRHWRMLKLFSDRMDERIDPLISRIGLNAAHRQYGISCSQRT